MATCRVRKFIKKEWGYMVLIILLASGIFAAFCLISPKRWWGKVEVKENDEFKS